MLAHDVIMPALGMAQETGILLQWLKAEGDEIAKGEPLMEVETDKAAVEVEAPASGMLANVTAHPGDEVPVGQVIAVILAPGEKAAPPSAAQMAARQSVQPQASQSAAGVSAGEPQSLVSPVAARIAAEHNIDLKQVASSGGRIQKEDVLAYLTARQATTGKLIPASPKARRLAAERNLDLAAINGSGPNGAVLAADVEAYVPPQPSAAAFQPPTAEPQTIAVSRMWQVMADRLTESWQTVPHFYLNRDVNASQLLTWGESVKQRINQTITLTDLLVKLVAIALQKHPRVNAAWHGGNIILNSEVNVGLAVAVEEGLLVPVIHQADMLGLADLAEQRRAVVERARSGKPALDDLQGGTFTVSNLGMFGIDTFNAIVNPPQAAILAVGRIADRVVPVDGQPGVQPMITLTLSCDHRVVDGARGAHFLHTLGTFIENPLAVLD